MTFSRPGTRQVNTQVAPQAPNRQQVQTVGGVSGAPVMRYQPPIVGEIPGGSALSTTAAGFLSGFVEPAQKQIAAWQEEERQRVAAEFIDANPSFTTEGMRNLTDEQRGILNRFDRRTQEVLLEQRMTQASLAYTTQFRQSVLNNDILVQPEDPLGDPVEAQARRGAELLRLKQEAQAAVGFEELPGFARITVLGKVAPVEQEAIGAARGARMAEERVLQKAQDRDYLGTTLEIGAAMAIDAAAKAPALMDAEAGVGATAVVSGQTGQVIPVQQAGAPSAAEFVADGTPIPVVAAGGAPTIPGAPRGPVLPGGPPAAGPAPRRAIELATIDAKMFIERRRCRHGVPESRRGQGGHLDERQSRQGRRLGSHRGAHQDVAGADRWPCRPRPSNARTRPFRPARCAPLVGSSSSPSTFAQAVRESGLSDDTLFTPEVQTRLALQLILGGKKRKELTDYLYGRSDDIDAAEAAASNEWAAVKGPGGKGAYDGDSAGNYASVSVRDLLPAMRNEVMGGGQPREMGAPVQLQTRERQQLQLMSAEQATQSVIPFDREIARRLKQGDNPRDLAGEIPWNLIDQMAKIDSRVSDPYEANQQKMAALGNVLVMLEQSGVEWGGQSFLDIPAGEKGVSVRRFIRDEMTKLSRAQEADAIGLLGQVMPGEALAQIMEGQINPADRQAQDAADFRHLLQVFNGDIRKATTVHSEIRKYRDRASALQGQASADNIFRQFGSEIVSDEPWSAEGKSDFQNRVVGAINSGRLTAAEGMEVLRMGNSRGVFTPEAFGQSAIFETNPAKSPIPQKINEEADQFIKDRDDKRLTGQIPVGREGVDDKDVPDRMREFVSKEYTNLLADAVAKNGGKPISPTDAQALVGQALEKGIATFRQNELGPGPASGLARFKTQVQQVTQNLLKTGGRLTVDTFPKIFIDATRQRLGRQNVTADEVRETFQNGARLQKEEDGTPAFPDGRRKGASKPLLQELMEGAKKKTQRQRAPSQNRYGISPQSSASPEPMSQTMASVGSEIEQVVAVVPPGATEVAETKPGVAEGRPEGAPEPEAVVVGAALGEALGVQLVQRRQGDQMLAFDPMGVMRNMVNSSAVKEFTDILRGRKPLTPSTPPLPQMKANTPLPPMPTQVDSNTHPAAIAIGLAEGTRRPDGSKTEAWYGHEDPNVPGRINIGTYSANAKDFASPQAADAYWSKRLTMKGTEAARLLHARGLKPTQMGWHRMMFNILDLEIQAPAANRMDGLLGKLEEISKGNYTVEAIAKARADSYINPATGKLETSFSSYERLLADQRRRAGMYDFKGRI